MKVMISQPMKGKTTEQVRAEREAVVKSLEAKGHTGETPKGFAKAFFTVNP